jgi:hypothetical protein
MLCMCLFGTSHCTLLNYVQFDSFLASAKAVGVELEVDDSKKLADSLDRAENPDDPYFNKVNFYNFQTLKNIVLMNSVACMYSAA